MKQFKGNDKLEKELLIKWSSNLYNELRDQLEFSLFVETKSLLEIPLYLQLSILGLMVEGEL